MPTVKPQTAPPAYKIPSNAPFQIGDHVTIHGVTRFGRPVVEGRGIVIGGGAVRHSYLVRMDGQPLPVYRVIKPGLSQTAPLRFIALKRAAYMANTTGKPRDKETV